MRGVKGYPILIIAVCLLIQPLSAVCPYCTTTPVSTQVSVHSSPQVIIDGLDLNGQLVKITNNGQNVVNLNVWSLKNQDSSLKFVFPHFLLNGGSSVLVYAGNGIDSNTVLYTHNMFDAWNTNGDTAYLYDSQGNLISKKTQGSIATPTPTPTPTVKPSISPIAYYSFDDGTAKDNSGNKNDGWIHGAQSIEGVKGNGMSFNGYSDYIDLPTCFTPYSELTMMIFFKTDNYAPQYLYTNVDRDVTISSENEINRFCVQLHPFWYCARGAITTDGKTWNHITGVLDKNINAVKYYQDGVRTDLVTTDPRFSRLEVYNRYRSKLGQFYDTDRDNRYYFRGSIDEFRIYNTALSDDEIYAIYQSYYPNPTPTPTPTPTTKPTVVPTTSAPTIVPTTTPQPTGSGIKSAFSASPRSGSLPLGVAFTDLSSGNPNTWSWSFGDGSYSNEKNPVYTYSEPGSYTVSLKVTGNGGSSSEKYGYIVVYDPSNPPTYVPTQIPTPTPTQTPVPTVVPTNPIKTVPTVNPTVTSGKLIADFTSNVRSGGLPLEVSFRDTSSGSPNKWFWSFGDGSFSEEQNPVHTFADQLSYSVSLEIKNTGGTATIIKDNWVTVL